MGGYNVEDGTKDLTSLSKKDTRGQVGTYSWSEERGHTDLLACLGP